MLCCYALSDYGLRVCWFDQVRAVNVYATHTNNAKHGHERAHTILFRGPTLEWFNFIMILCSNEPIFYAFFMTFCLILWLFYAQ